VDFRPFGFMQFKLFSHSPGSEMVSKLICTVGLEKLMLHVEGHGSISSQISEGYSDSKDCFVEYGKVVIG
jgi:hypothetical protein